MSAPRPQDSAEWDTADPDRAARVQARQERVAGLLDARGLDAALLTDPANLAWVTCGAELAGGFGDAGGGAGGGPAGAAPAVFFTHSSRVLLCGSADGPHLVDRELSGLGFQLKQRPWFEPAGELAADLCRGRTVGADRVPFPPAPDGAAGDPADLSEELARWRAVLDAGERTALAALAADVAHAVEAACRGATAGRTECDLAGEVAHRLWRRGVRPVVAAVAGDGRDRARPHYQPDRRPVRAFAHVRAVGRRGGLHAHCARTVLFPAAGRAVRDELAAAHARAVQIQAAGLHFARAGAAWAALWPKVARIYEKTGGPGAADDWRPAPVAVRTGFAPAEAAPGPAAELVLEPGSAWCWQPRCGPAACGDTVLITDDGPAEVFTNMEDWPRVTVAVKGTPYRRPGVWET